MKCETNDLEVIANANFVIEGYVDPSPLHYDATSPLEKPLRDEGPFGDHTGYGFRGGAAHSGGT